MIDRNDVRRGQTACDSEGTRLGRVIQCDQSGFFIEKGLVFTEDYRVEYDEVEGLEAMRTLERYVPRWKESPLFSPRERAALAWTEAVTRLGADHVDDRNYALARAWFGEEALVNLTLAVIAVNGWNRLATAFRARPDNDPPGAR